VLDKVRLRLRPYAADRRSDLGNASVETTLVAYLRMPCASLPFVKGGLFWLRAECFDVRWDPEDFVA